jgi:pimeloyl-ACP methyl ester carboxylesterase
MNTMVKAALMFFGVALMVAALAGAWSFRRDMAHAQARLSGTSQVIASPYGETEFSQGGEGPPVLVVHGSGGGFDQGELVVRSLLGPGFRWIAPSRFGYLRSSAPPGATFDDQAHAFAHLLDQLGIARVAVVAFSHGGPSALLFAALHPDRVSSLTLISAGVASTAAAEQSTASQKGETLVRVFEHDWLYWGLTRLFRHQFMALMGASDPVIAGLTPEQRALVDAVIDDMNPASRRAAGAAFDNRAAMPNQRIAAIRAPTLILHARDDSLQIFQNAEFAARHIAGARLIAFDRGGHLLFSVEREQIRLEVERHLREFSSNLQGG